MINEEYNNLPRDVIKSLAKMEKIIKIIETNLFLPKDDILREINIEIGSTQKAMDIFSQYYPDKGVNLSIYIIQRKKSEAQKAIKNLTNPTLINRKIYEITQMYKSNFNQSLKNNPLIIEAFDMKKVYENINNIYDTLYNLNNEKIIKTKISRTKILIEDRDWNVGLRMIFAMREYISFGNTKNMEKLIDYDMLLQEHEWMEYYIKNMKNYNVNTAFDHAISSWEEFYDNKQNRITEFLLYYKENKNFNMDEVTYYCVDRSYLKDVINNFSLPNNLHQYRTILSKSKLALRMMMKSDDYILSYVNHFKSIIDNHLEREVFSYLAEREEQNLDGHIKEIHQYLCKKYKNLSKNNIEEAMKNLLLKGFISLYIWNTQLW